MTVRELIERLNALDPDVEIVYFDRVTGDRLEPVLNLHAEFDNDRVRITGRVGDRQ